MFFFTYINGECVVAVWNEARRAFVFPVTL